MVSWKPDGILGWWDCSWEITVELSRRWSDDLSSSDFRNGVFSPLCE
jgi:hypothetical protein